MVWDPERRWRCAEFHGEVGYVPARDRTPVHRFLCLGCHTDVWPIMNDLRTQAGGACPTCGPRIDAAFAPPRA